jgi:hypothetical protein
MSRFTTLIWKSLPFLAKFPSRTSPPPLQSPPNSNSTSLEELDTLEDKIVLNSHELKIHEASIQASQTKTESTVLSKNITYDDKNRTATLEFGEKIRHDNRKSVLSLSFDGILNDTMAGFYRSAYTDANGEKAYMFSSQCEVIAPHIMWTDGRRVMHGGLFLVLMSLR